MAPKVLTTNQLADQQVDDALPRLLPTSAPTDGTLMLLRNLQAQITDLNDRVTTLEEA
jgi:hypothetical protein